MIKVVNWSGNHCANQFHIRIGWLNSLPASLVWALAEHGHCKPRLHPQNKIFIYQSYPDMGTPFWKPRSILNVTSCCSQDPGSSYFYFGADPIKIVISPGTGLARLKRIRHTNGSGVAAMAKIPLRTYLQEIERLVDSQRIDEAVSHSRYILQFYPKYIDVYRVLGKAYLEVKRYGDAADIFQRVLSSLPEDFVSNAGMSIIREDEGNLDEAIWHMERAFEIEPSNSTIQDELRRLIGKRDGIEPQRIRLTRGALARMYMKGDLTQEAITELRIALTEDANRLDLRALLAVALNRVGQRVESIDVANQVLRNYRIIWIKSHHG
jgi:hypothetical protein